MMPPSFFCSYKYGIACYTLWCINSDVAVATGGIGSRKGKVVNDKGNLRWRFPVNSEVGSLYLLLTNHNIKNHVVSMLHAH